jgi:hypothetical protein
MSPRARWLTGFAGFAAFIGAHLALGGLRPDQFALALAGCALWAAPKRLRPAAWFLAPFVILAAVYDFQRYWAETLRGPVHVIQPHDWELSWFGIASHGARLTPAAWCQAHTSAALDLVLGAAYLLFIPAFVAIAAWWRFGERRSEANDVMWGMLWLNLAAYATYMAYPAAPPWYVDHYGLGPAVLAAPPEAGGASRFDSLVHLPLFGGFYSHNTNVFGAIPSLHVGQTFFAALYAWRFRSLAVSATAFWLIVWVASVYLDHHYIVDGVVGIAYAGIVFAAMVRLRKALRG